MKRRLDLASGRIAKLAFTLLIAAALVGCASSLGPSYRPKGPDGSIGYTDEQLAPNRFRVTFAGPAGSKLWKWRISCSAVRPEITLKAGYTHFVFNMRRTEANLHGRRAGRGWNPALGLLFECGRDGRRTESGIDMNFTRILSGHAVVQYTASSEIVVMKPRRLRATRMRLLRERFSPGSRRPKSVAGRRLERAEHRADGKDGMKRWPVVLLAAAWRQVPRDFTRAEPSRLATIIDLVARRDSIASGFVGMANFGHWRLICVRGPAPLQGLLAASAKENKSGQASGNACRVNQEIERRARRRRPRLRTFSPRRTSASSARNARRR